MPARQRKQQRSEAELVTIIAGALAAGATANAMAATLSPLIGIPVAPLEAALAIATSRPIRYSITVIPSATASAAAQDQEAHFRALYVLNAARRLAAGGSIADERRFFNQHMVAVRKRRDASSAIDKAAFEHGNLLGWYAVLDSRTSPECRAANGKNFSATRIPMIGFPGSVHPNCRCKAGRKHATEATVYPIRIKVA